MNKTEIISVFECEKIEACKSLFFIPLEKYDHVRLKRYDGTEACDEFATNVCSFWNKDMFYALFEGNFVSLQTVPPEFPVHESTGKTFKLWEHSDVYEIFIGPDSRKSRIYREFQIAPDARWIDIAIDASRNERKTDFNWVSNFNAHSETDYNKKQWRALFTIPWTAFSHKPQKNEIWECNFYRILHLRKNNEYLSWLPVRIINFHQPEYFGNIKFV